MSSLPPWAIAALPVAVLLVTGLLCGAAWLALRRRQAPPRHAPGTLRMTCSICQKTLVFHQDELELLSAVECALAVREKPDLVGRKLAEYVCPYCEAAHCFVISGKRMQWVAANLYEPQETTARCAECQKPLRRPPWPPGQYEGKLGEAPALAPDYGLVCSLCHAVCCVQCCVNLTRAGVREGKWTCPRCSRQSTDRLFYP